MSRRWLPLMPSLLGRPAWLTVFRPLPLSCAVMALLLVVKTKDVVHLMGGAPAALLSAGRAVLPAAEAAAHGAAAAPAKPAAPAPAPAPHAAAGPAAPAAAPAAAVVAAVPPAPQEPPVGESERALLLDLRARRGQIEAREQALAARDAVLAAAEKRIGERVEQLQARLEALDGARRERDDANWRGLVKTYEVMRPRDAAAILNELEMPVLLQVLDRMKEGRAAVLLAAMLPDRARTATAQLAAMRTRAVAPPVLPSAAVPAGAAAPAVPAAPGVPG